MLIVQACFNVICGQDRPDNFGIRGRMAAVDLDPLDGFRSGGRKGALIYQVNIAIRTTAEFGPKLIMTRGTIAHGMMLSTWSTHLKAPSGE